MGQSPTPLPLAYSVRSWSTARHITENNYGLLPLDMLQVMGFRVVTHAARGRVYFTTFTFTTPLFWYSFQFDPSELNRSLYDVTHWSSDGLPCVAILFTTLSFPMSICKYCPMVFRSVDQEPVLPLFWTLLRRACHDSYPGAWYEEAVTFWFGISLFSIPRGWMGHAVGIKTNYFLFTVFRKNDPHAKSQSALYWMQMALSSLLLLLIFDFVYLFSISKYTTPPALLNTPWCLNKVFNSLVSYISRFNCYIIWA